MKFKSILMPALLVAALLGADAVSAKSPSRKEIKVMSFNIRNAGADDGDNSWDIRKPAVPAMLADQAPVVFGVQEAYQSQVDYILENCPQFACVGVGRDDGVHAGEHMSVFYNKDIVELLDWGTYWLSETPDVPSMGWDAACFRTATWTLLKIKKTGQKFYFVNTHLDHRGVAARKNGLALIVERIGAMNPEGLPMVLTGDFNVRPDNPGLEDLNKIMKSARIYAEDSDDKTSYNAWGKRGSVIDYIYYAGFKKCLDFKVVDASYAGKPYVSDHFPVIAKLVF